MVDVFTGKVNGKEHGVIQLGVIDTRSNLSIAISECIIQIIRTKIIEGIRIDIVFRELIAIRPTATKENANSSEVSI